MSKKIALVTGGNRGLGKSAALAFAERGIDVILTFNTNKKEGEAVVAAIEKLGGKARAIQLDVSSTKNFPAFVKEVTAQLKSHWSRDSFDFLINNAGVGEGSSFAETTEDQFDNLMNIHFKGVYFLTQKLLPILADKGRIINVSTGLTRFASPGYSAYAAMKGAMEVLTKYQAKELGPRGISVNIIAPGAIETDFRGGAVRDNADVKKFLSSQTALGRVGLPDDIGPLMALMCADEMGWMTAQRLEASGGMFL